MKVLKRPMFRYGGDVRRQGIMHGMNGLRNGGMATTMADATGYANGGITMFPPMRGRVTRPGGYAGEPLSIQQQIEQQKAKTKALQGPKYTDQILDQKFNKFIDNYYGGNQEQDLYNEVEMTYEIVAKTKEDAEHLLDKEECISCLLYTSPSPRDS